MATKEYFLDIPNKLRALDENQRPFWGNMTPQHMVEHIVGSWRISNGRARVGAMLPEEEIQKRREFLFSDTEYQQNIPNPTFPGNKLPPLRKKSFAEAVDQLEDEMKAFFEFHEANPKAIETHPVFGELDSQGWLRFQEKHMGHHLRQFGIEG